MHLTRLRLDQFRSWRTLDLPLERGLNLVSGPNAAGKTNLIEAGWMLAALRSLRATREGELIAWDAPAPQLMRLVGDAESRQGPVAVEIVIAARSDGSTGLSGAPLTSKRIRVNGVPRQASEALGAIRAVLFSALDIELLTGESRLRRRYLDVAVSQADRAHAVALSRYQRTVRQRNALLRSIAHGRGAAAELAEWDALLSREAGRIWSARAAAVAELAAAAAQRHRDLHGDDLAASETLDLRYLPATGSDCGAEPSTPAAWEARMREALDASRRRDLARGVTSVGPHRDELELLLAGRAVGPYGSRAQQRGYALALRLAEADLLTARTGEQPILLLDDLFSELDHTRRERCAEFLRNAEQVILTTARPETMPAALPTPSNSWQIQDGGVSRRD